MNHPASVPHHVGIIMDGNGRWASAQGLPRSLGHKKGAEVVKKIVKASADAGVKVLTLFAFSEENWKRPTDEVSLLMHLAESYIAKELNELIKENVRFKVIGSRSKLPKNLQTLIEDAEQKTQHNTKFNLNIALSYSARQDILAAVKALLLKNVDPNTLDETAFSALLSLGEFSDPDLIIRTSGEHRISNFLLWESAYSEFFFTPEMWPDFNESTLTAALASYQQRQRRFGTINAI
jgi:undecaprenyl diphosphate synthase